MGYAWQGKCYGDTASALNAFSLSVPTADTQGIVTLASASISATGLIAWKAQGVRLQTGPAASVWGPVSYTTQLPTCAAPQLDQWPVQTLLFIVALFFAAMLGFKTGYRP